MIARGPRSRAAAIQALIAVALANASTDLFKHFWPEPRPYQELADALLHTGRQVAVMRAGDAANFGTASAHSANMMAVALVFCLRLKWWGLPWVVVALGVGFSRIYLSAHYPYQVLLGYACGLTIAFAVVKTWDLVSGRMQPEERNLASGTTDLT
jgi:undecaprenyl-diphosphatase